MWAYVIKDRGSRYLPVSTDEDYNFIIREYNNFYEQIIEYRKLTSRIDSFLKIHHKNFAWFNPDMVKDADKESLYRFSWILIRLFERNLDKRGLMSKYTFLRELRINKNHDTAFTNYFGAPDKIGTYLAFILSPEKILTDNITISGFPFFRLLWAPVGIIFRSNILLRFLWTITYNWLGYFDWALLGIPYLIAREKSGLPKQYFDAERLIGRYLYGNSKKAKSELRRLVKKDKDHFMAYFVSMWAVFLREKLVEIIIDDVEAK